MMLDRVLVIGGSGFIGSRLMKRHPDWSNCDTANAADCRDIIQFDGYDAVVLLAADLTSTLDSYSYNLSIYSSLALATANSSKPPFVLYVSSAAVYAPTSLGLHYESEFPGPSTLYGKSKLLGEQIIQDTCNDCTILRLSNVYGDGDGHGVIDGFKNGEKTIYGDGTQVRDYIYVEKVVKAIDRVMASPGRYSNQTFNISTGVGRTVNDVFKEYGKGEPIYVPERDEDVSYSVLSNADAKKEGLL